jgi:hypothetical protein
MVADSDSCFCDVCGTVCPGRFRGCPAVWAAGPQPVVLGTARRSPPPTKSKALTTSAHNGSRPALEAAIGSPPIATTPARTVPFDRSQDVPTLIAALGAEVRHLGRTMDSMVAYLGLSDGESPAADGELVVQFRRSMAAALNEHRLTMERELQQMKRELLLHIDAIDETPVNPPPDNTELLSEIDRRFEWLVRSVSDRLVVIGNELVRLQAQVGLSPGSPGNGHVNGNGRIRAAVPSEERVR